MTQKLFLILHSFVLLNLGMQLFLVGDWWLPDFGIIVPPAGLLILWLFAAFLLGNALLGWFVRDVTDTRLLRPYFFSQGSTWSITAIVLLMGLRLGLINQLAWIFIGLSLVWLAGFTFYWLQAGRQLPGNHVAFRYSG